MLTGSLSVLKRCKLCKAAIHFREIRKAPPAGELRGITNYASMSCQSKLKTSAEEAEYLQKRSSVKRQGIKGLHPGKSFNSPG